MKKLALIIIFTLSTIFPAQAIDWENTFDGLVLVTGKATDPYKAINENNPYDKFFEGPPSEDDEKIEELDEEDLRNIGMGTGFWIDEHHIVTNYHVIKNYEEISIYSYNFPFEVTDVTVIGYDKEVDIAVIRVNEKIPHKILPWATTTPKMGDRVYGLGHGLQLVWTFTEGILSSNYRPRPGTSWVHYYQTDAVINPGNSGGPLLNEWGQVVGVNTLIISPTKFYIGYGYAVPYKLARRVALQLIETGYHIKPSIGVQLGIVEDREHYYKLIELDVPSFLEIKEVVEGSSAERFGLLPGDIIISIDGVKVEASPDVIEFLWGKMPGDVIVVEVWRTNNKKEQLHYINVTLDAMEPSSDLFGN